MRGYNFAFSCTALASVVFIGSLNAYLQEVNIRLRTLLPLSWTNCETPSYTVRFLSYDPLIIHLENFISYAERQHLRRVGMPLLERSEVAARNGTKIVSPHRTSLSAFVPSSDPVAKCILERVSEFQGYEPLANVEPLQMTAYQKDQQYSDHFDWFGPQANVTRDRATTFFAILDADCENCGTNFPALAVNWSTQDRRWCRIVDCGSPNLTALPLPGSALFWRNLDSEGSGDVRMKHAGLPLSRGVKVGINIWTTQELV